MHYLITGAAGFVGSNWLDVALKAGHQVTAVDNFSTGFKQHLEQGLSKSPCRLLEIDILDVDPLTQAMEGVDVVFHFAANADIRFGLQHPEKDLQQNTIGTLNVLQAMRAQNVGKLVFASTGAVYGDASQIPTPEDAKFPVQTSLYGASKVAAEGLIQAFCEGFGMQAAILRFVSLVGPRYSHGHIFDFCQQLLNDPENLNVLGNGMQRKSYLHVSDCMAAIELVLSKLSDKVNIFNLGNDDTCVVNDSIRWICQALAVEPNLSYSGGERGWVGDSPLIHLDCSRLKTLGFKPQFSIKDGVKATVAYLLENQWLFEHRC